MQFVDWLGHQEDGGPRETGRRSSLPHFLGGAGQIQRSVSAGRNAVDMSHGVLVLDCETIRVELTSVWVHSLGTGQTTILGQCVDFKEHLTQGVEHNWFGIGKNHSSQTVTLLALLKTLDTDGTRDVLTVMGGLRRRIRKSQKMSQLTNLRFRNMEHQLLFFLKKKKKALASHKLAWMASRSGAIVACACLSFKYNGNDSKINSTF